MPVGSTRLGARVASFVLVVVAAVGGNVTSAAAQDAGTVAGSVYGLEDRRPVEGASAMVLGTALRAQTDGAGRFRFTAVPVGPQRIAVRAIGYVADTVSVTIAANGIAEVEILLRTSPVTLQELTVTAQKRSESIQEVPIAVTAYDGATLIERNVQEFDGLSNFTPGLNVQLQSANNPGFVIRGITSDDGSSQVEPRVSVFQDGVSISKSRGSVVELFDLERVEVLKGPQGTLFGRGAQIGAVHVIQNKASDRSESEITVGGGNYAELFTRGFVNAPLVQGKLFGRLSGIYNKRDGFLENTAGGTLNGKNTVAVRGNLRWLPSASSTVDLIVNYQKDDSPGISFKSGTYAPPGGNTTPFGPVGLESGDELGVDRSVYGATLLWNEMLSRGWSLTSISAARRFDSDEAFDADGTLAPVLRFNEIAKGDQLSQEFRFNYDGGGQVAGFVGTSFFYEKGSQRVPFRTDERSLFALFSPFLSGAGVPFIPLVNSDGTANLSVTNNPLTGAPFKTVHEEAYENFGRTVAAELFADATIRPSPRLSLTAGLRGTYEDVSNAYEVTNSATPGSLGFILDAGPNNLFAPTNGRVTGAGSFTSAVGRAIAKYEVSPAVNIFASVARGRRPNVINVTDSGADTLSAETVWSYEAGLKASLLQDRVQFDLNGYRYRYSNFQTTIARLDPDAGGLITLPEDAGRAGAWGLETSVRAAVARSLTLFATYGFVDAKFDSTDANGDAQGLAGNTFRLTAKHSFSAGFTLQTMDSRSGSLFLSPNISVRSRVFFQEDNVEGIEQPSVALVGLRAGYRLPGGKTEIAVIARNVLNKEYIIDAGNTGGAFGIPTFIAGQPRLISVQLTQSLR